MNRGRFWSSTIVAALVAMYACGGGGPPKEYVYVEDFEVLCDEVPCGWERVAGGESQATWVETIHPGEHGLRLSGETSVRGPGSEDEVEPFYTSDVRAVLAARCDGGSELVVEVIFAGENGEPVVQHTTVAPYADWTGPTHGWLDGASDIRATRVLAVGITKTGAGTCEISDLVLEVVDHTPVC